MADDIRQSIKAILSPAIDVRTPYAQAMVDALLDLAAAPAPAPQVGEIVAWLRGQTDDDPMIWQLYQYLAGAIESGYYRKAGEGDDGN